MFTGTSGVGKSAMVLDTLNRLTSESELVPVNLNFSAQTSSIATQVRSGTHE
jgi:dynein heavy chain